MNKFLIVFLLIATKAVAQPTIFDPSHVKWNDTELANKLSNIGVATGIGLDVIDVFRSEDKKHASVVLAERYAVLVVTTEVIKLAVHRIRPDNSDNKSYLSEHTVFASGRWYIGIPVGYLRMAADKHYLTDVASGFAFRKFINKVIK